MDEGAGLSRKENLMTPCTACDSSVHNWSATPRTYEISNRMGGQPERRITIVES
jgi:5-methylcytosine-specific restriction endonuclease McrA